MLVGRHLDGVTVSVKKVFALADDRTRSYITSCTPVGFTLRDFELCMFSLLSLLSLLHTFLAVFLTAQTSFSVLFSPSRRATGRFLNRIFRYTTQQKNTKRHYIYLSARHGMHKPLRKLHLHAVLHRPDRRLLPAAGDAVGRRRRRKQN